MFRLEDKSLREKVQTFRGKIYVSIREFYQKEGNDALLPGEKGLNLDMKQWNELKLLMSKISESLKEAESLFQASYPRYHLQPERKTNNNDDPFKLVGISYFQGKLYLNLREHKRYRKFSKFYQTKKVSI
ncbi:RNA polymerase II transcriptional coactivator KIWI [Holothuria leucospilota]|uniref:RNA polymerase II transcriptional coactivator KIWI n=1 Tax=Holothuria leucospilota TaxID=206669 RepID=A0A9Q1CTC2_HOLLE|nr:RNA polymerase II transcriptional coactivator KIWI [Holothuria leucospilota]